ncbi:hypothetical protein NQU96_18275 [Pseudoalteromonas elyakovii]|nr:hypothetical protein [Pseudoalteromonas elyakovii]
MTKKLILFISLLVLGCSPLWEEPPYQVYFSDNSKKLGYSLGEGAFIGRIDEPKLIASNDKYISVLACPENICSYFYIDKVNDHKYAEHNEFVFGPYTRDEFTALEFQLALPKLK